MKPINDRPVFNFPYTYAPVIPYNMTSWTNTGFQIKKITSENPLVVAQRINNPDVVIQYRSLRPFAHDSEQANLGFCVVDVRAADHGNWQVKMAKGKWEDLIRPHRRRNEENVMEAVCFEPTDRLR